MTEGGSGLESTPQPDKDGGRGRAAFRPAYVLLSACALFGAMGVWRTIQGSSAASHFDLATLVGSRFVWLSLVRGDLLPAFAIIVSMVLLVTGSDVYRHLSLRGQRALFVGLVVPLVVFLGVVSALAGAAGAATAVYGVELAAFVQTTPATASDIVLLVFRGISGGVVIALAWRWVGWRDRPRRTSSPSAVARDAAVACSLSIAAEFVLATAFIKTVAVFE